MPVRKVKDGWRYGNRPTIHKTKKEAEAQRRAIKAEQKRRKK